MSWSADQDRHIARALGRAIRHVRRVAIRPHIATDRDERLNQFVVSVRRELSALRGLGKIIDVDCQSLSAVLAEKKHWYDIGQINANTNGVLHYRAGNYTTISPAQITSDDVKRWLKLSRHLETETEAQAYDIATDIEEIERGIGSLEESVDEVQRINQEGDQLAHQLAALFS